MLLNVFYNKKLLFINTYLLVFICFYFIFCSCSYSSIKNIIIMNGSNSKDLQIDKSNLIPCIPTGWDDKIVVSDKKETFVQSEEIYANEIVYVDFAIGNAGSKDTGSTFQSKLLLNGELYQTFTHDILPSMFYSYLSDLELIFYKSGDNTLTVICDSENEVDESDEKDNLYTMQIFVISPENDYFTNSIQIDKNYNGSNRGATIETNEPIHANSRIGSSVWFHFSTTDNGYYSINTYGSDFDTILAVYSGDSLEELLEITSNDDDDDLNTDSSVTIYTKKNTRYYIALDGYQGATGNYSINMKIVNTPKNDNFADAISIVGTSGSMLISNIYATNEENEPEHVNQKPKKSVWWKWTIQETEYYQIDTHDSTFDTLIAVYEGNTIKSLTSVVSNNDTNGETSAVEFWLKSNILYYICVDGYGGHNGTISLNWNKVDRPANDDFIWASKLSGVTGKTICSNIHATAEINELAHMQQQAKKTLWWYWTPSQTGTYRFYTYESSFDTVMNIYTGDSINNLTDIPKLISSIQEIKFFAELDETYYIVADSYNDDSGDIVLNWEKINDNFADAIIINGLSGQISDTNLDASKENGEPLHANNEGGKSLWWKWTPPSSGYYSFNTFGSDFNTLLAVYTGSGIDTLKSVAFNDDDKSKNTNSSLFFYAHTGLNYYIAVDGYNGDSGNVIMNWKNLMPLSAGQYSMRINGNVYIDEKVIQEEGYILAAFGSEGYTLCYGIADLIESQEGWFYDLLISSNQPGEEIFFSVLDSKTGNIYHIEDTILFSENETIQINLDIPLQVISITPKNGIVGKDLNLTIKGYGFDRNTRVSMYNDTGNKRTLISLLQLDDAECIVIRDNYAFVADDGLKIIDISDPVKPFIVAFVKTPGSAFDIEIVNNFAYIADWSQGLQIIDISNIKNPKLIATANTSHLAFEVIVKDDIAFVADGKSGVQVIDVKDPYNPTTIEHIPCYSFAYGIDLLGNILFMADRAGLHIINANDTENLSRISFIETNGSFKKVQVVSNFAYVADSDNGLVIIDISNVQSPSVISNYKTTKANNIFLIDKKLFLSDINEGLKIIDVSNPYSPTLIGTIDTPGYANCTVVKENLAYIADEYSLRIVNIDNPSTNHFFASLKLGDFANGIDIVNNTAFIADGDNGLVIVDIEKTNNPMIIGHVDTPGDAVNTKVIDDIAYIADSKGGLQIIDVKDYSNPKIISCITTESSVESFDIVDNILYIAGGMDGLKLVNISNKDDPKLIRSFGLEEYVKDVKIIGNNAYIANRVDGLKVLLLGDIDFPLVTDQIDMTYATKVEIYYNHAFVIDLLSFTLKIVNIEPNSHPSLIKQLKIPGSQQKIEIDSNKAYIASGSYGVQVVDISDPLNATIIGYIDTPVFAMDVKIKDNIAYIADGGGGLIISNIPQDIPIDKITRNSIDIKIPAPELSGYYTLKVFNNNEYYELPGAISFLEPIDGDIDGNRTINLQDLVTALQVLSGQFNSDCLQMNYYGDINNDNKISFEELVYLFNKIAFKE